jgi:CRP-like cAMP-binding protein
LEIINRPVRPANSTKFGRPVFLFTEEEPVLKTFGKYITENVVLDQDELDLIRSLCFEKAIKKHQFVLREGEICRYNTFVAKGCLLSYRVDASGIEHALQFSFENRWANDQESLVNGTPANCNIEAIENTEVIMWTKSNFESLKRQIPELQKFVTGLIEKSIQAAQNRIYSIISQSTEEKYESFIRSYPDLLQRLPLHRIASYLGVSREILSRIKRQSRLRF